MEDFTSYFHKLHKPSPPRASLSSTSDQLNSSNNNMELFLNSFSQEVLNNNSNNNTNNQPFSSTSSSSHYVLHGVPDYYSSSGFHHQFPITGNNESNPQGLFCPIEPGFVIEKDENNSIPMSEFAEVMMIPSSPGFGSESGVNKSDKNHGIEGRKRKRKNIIEGEVMEKPKDVVHVRAKRGQATDSHSLAERVRRERINEKLRVLQDLVPGCYKTMGMAVMLDVIINYVRSLQNQIEFLSMKLSAASMYYDFNSPEAEALDTLQRTTNSFEAHEMKKMAGDQGYNIVGITPPVQSTRPF